MITGPEQDKNSGLIFNIQRFSLHDGPGIRTTVFFKGCPLSCRWCSNPESINPYPEIMTYDIKCIRCGKCIDACPNQAIKVVDNMRSIDRSSCNLCLECANVCPSGAIEKVGSYKSQEDLLREIDKDRLFFKNSNGGVTFSGGEPLLQWQFVREVCKLCRERNISTILDTTGCAHWDIMEQVLEFVDLVLYDIKHLDPLKHIEGTGVRNDLILENIKKTARKVNTWLRIPIIPNYNDSTAYIKTLGEFSADLGIEKVSLLPYHTWGEHKYERLGKEYDLKGIESLVPESLQGIKETVESYGLVTTVGR